MRLAGALACFVCLAEGFAQSNAALDAIRYPRLASLPKFSEIFWFRTAMSLPDLRY
jgi:hypothetical protein